MGMVINICCGKVPDFTKIGKPKIAEIHYIMCQEDLMKFENLKKENPEIIWRFSKMRSINKTPVLKSADRAGYYIIKK